MSFTLTLASGSTIRAALLQNSCIPFKVNVPRIDEQSLKESLVSEGVTCRDLADALAEFKARNISQQTPDAFVLGADQVLEFKGEALSKPVSADALIGSLKEMRGKDHKLFSAAVIYHDFKPVWRHVGQVRLRMCDVSDDYIENYVSRNWDEVRHCVGGYQLEAEGVRLFNKIEGDYFHVLGLPLLEILDYLTLRGVIEG